MSLSSGDIPNVVKFLSASIAGMTASLICYPMDIIRLRMQLIGEGESKSHRETTYAFMRRLLKNEGVGTFYNGVSAALLRQCLYTGGRLGFFQVIVDYITKDGAEINFQMKLMAGTISGCVGAVLGLPPDVALTRMAVDNSSLEADRRNYKHVFDAMKRIFKEEGPLVLYTGLKVTILRSVIVNCSQLVTYAESKEWFLKYKIMEDKLPLHGVCSFIATVVLTVCALPPDIAKTRLQKMRITNGVPEYTGFMDVWLKILKAEGFFSIWKGFTPFFIKAMPYNLILFIVYEDFLLENYKRYASAKRL